MVVPGGLGYEGNVGKWGGGFRAVIYVRLCTGAGLATVAQK